jgi:hypothetical protein
MQTMPENCQMKISLVTYESTGFHKEPVLRIIGKVGNDFMPVKTLSDEDLENFLFLCKSKDDEIFVSYISYDSSLGYYVDDVKHQMCISITDLEELQIIE